MTAPDVVSLRSVSAAEQLEQLARSPLQPHRDELRALTKRLRALEAFALEHDQQLTLEDVA